MLVLMSVVGGFVVGGDSGYIAANYVVVVIFGIVGHGVTPTNRGVGTTDGGDDVGDFVADIDEGSVYVIAVVCDVCWDVNGVELVCDVVVVIAIVSQGCSYDDVSMRVVGVGGW